MDSFTVMELAKEYARLGWSTQEQIDTILEGQPIDELIEIGEVNPDAVAEAQTFFELLDSITEEGWTTDLAEYFRK